MKKKLLMLSCVAGALVVLDQLTKTIVVTRYSLGETSQVIANFFHITYVQNQGAAFGLLAQSHPDFREYFFLILPPIAMLVIFWALKNLTSRERIQIFSLSLVFGGALGNYIDRVRFRFVVDFLDVHYKDIYHWPAFNVADMGIVSGVTILFILTLFQKENDHDDEKESDKKNEVPS